MAPNPRVVSAFRAMKAIGIPQEKVKPALKKLLKVYKSWELIEEDNYRTLADAIFENEEAEAAKCQESSENAEQEALLRDKPQRPLQKLCLEHQVGQPTESHLENQSPGVSDSLQPMDNEKQNGSDLTLVRKKGKQPVSFNSLELQEGYRSHHIAMRVGSSSGPGIQCSRMRKLISDNSFIKPKEVPITDDSPRLKGPDVTILPGSSNQGESSTTDGLTEEKDAFDTSLTMGGSNRSDKAESNAAKSSYCMEVASSLSGEVTVTLNCGSTLGRSKLHMPTREEVLKLLEDKCVKKYKHLDLNFSVIKVMTDVCQCFLELGSESINKSSAKQTIAD